jgi:hypothetical protein
VQEAGGQQNLTPSQPLDASLEAVTPRPPGWSTARRHVGAAAAAATRYQQQDHTTQAEPTSSPRVLFATPRKLLGRLFSLQVREAQREAETVKVPRLTRGCSYHHSWSCWSERLRGVARRRWLTGPCVRQRQHVSIPSGRRS